MWWTVDSVFTNLCSTMNVSLPPGNDKVFQIYNILFKLCLWMCYMIFWYLHQNETVQIKNILTTSPFGPGAPPSPLSPFIRNQRVHSYTRLFDYVTGIKDSASSSTRGLVDSEDLEVASLYMVCRR